MNPGAALSAAFNLRPGEGRPTLLLLTHSFCLGLTTVSFSTAAHALFLAAFTVETLPYVYIGSAGMTVLSGFLYAKLQVRLPFSTLLPFTLIFLLLAVCAFRLALWLTNSTWLAFGLLFWLRMLIVLVNLEFWGLAGRLFNVRQGKRLFGLIGCGELTANILGGLATPLFVMGLGTPNLLLLSATGLTLALALLLITIHSCGEQLASPSEIGETGAQTPSSALTVLLQNHYIVLIILSHVLMVIVYNFVDYMFYDHTQVRYQDEAHLASFLGPFFATVQIISMLIKTFLTGRLFNRYGLRFGLLAHPILLIAGTTLIAFTSTVWGSVSLLFWLVVMIKLCDEVLWTSIYDPSLLILYQPLHVEQRRAVQVAVQSIFGPLSIVLSGLLLLLFGTTEVFTSVHLTYLVPLILVGAIAVAKVVSGAYVKALIQALTKRLLEGNHLSLQDRSSLAVLQQKLQSSHPGEVLYALDLLEKIEHVLLPEFLVDLLEHPHVDVRQDVLGRIERMRLPALLDRVRNHIASEEAPKVRAAALQALCALGDDEVVEHVALYLNDADPQVRIGVMVGLLRHGGITGVLLAGERLMHMANAPEPALRMLAAQVLGEVGIRSFYQPLVKLLHDDSPAVCRAALIAAGNIRHPKLWPLVLAHLSSLETGAAAFAALIAGGASVMPELAAVFTKTGQERRMLIRIARICGRLRGDRAMALLRQALDFPDQAVRSTVLASLSLCGFRAQGEAYLAIQQYIAEEVADATWVLAAMADVGDAASESLMYIALSYELDQIRKRLFFLLSFICDAQAIWRARDNLTHASAERRAYALEILDVLIPQELKTLLLPIFDDLTPAQCLHHLHHRFPQPSLGRNQRLQEVITRPDARTTGWTKACALYTVARLSHLECIEAVVSALSTPDPLVRETAVWTLLQLDPAGYRRHVRELYNDPSPQVVRVLRQRDAEPQGGKAMLLTIEKVIILKTVDIFSETPDEVLAEVASILEEVEVKAGETIIEKDEIGRCMYIIVDGQVRVHEGEHTLAHLGARDIFGELAVLDPEPRSASVTAIADTRLFRLDQDAFYELMADRIEVARGIIRVLCRRVRARIISTQRASSLQS